LDSLKKALAERALNAEMDHRLGNGDQAGNSRNGYGRKTVVTGSGKIDIDVPRDRSGSWTVLKTSRFERLRDSLCGLAEGIDARRTGLFRCR